MKVYIARHGQTFCNAMKKHNMPDTDLTELGISQAEKLRDEIKDIDFDVIISSPLIRAKHTADIINIHNKKILFDDRIKERECGDLMEKPLDIIDRNEYWNYNTTIQYGTSENIKLFFERVFNFLDELKAQEYKSVLIVAHKGVARAFSCYFEGIQDGILFNRGLKNCQIKEYEL